MSVPSSSSSEARAARIAPLLVRALRGERVERTPVWLMRQAGRYLPEYRAVREKHDFLTMCRSAELAAEVTLQPIRRFGFDAAIVFSDILLVPDAMGVRVRFEEGEGPVMENPVRDRGDVARLREIDPDRDLPQVGETIRILRRELPAGVPVIGFAGAPFTLLSYMVGGKGEQGLAAVRAMLRSDPETAHALLDALSRAVAAHLAAQVAAGAEAVQLFDTWAGTLPREPFRVFAAAAAARVFEALAKSVPAGTPMIYFARGATHLLPCLAETGATAFGLDWLCEFDEARAVLGRDVALQGNLDPAVLLAGDGDVRREVAAVLAAAGPRAHVFNLGHGVLPRTDPERVRTLVEAVRELGQSDDAPVP